MTRTGEAANSPGAPELCVGGEEGDLPRGRRPGDGVRVTGLAKTFSAGQTRIRAVDGVDRALDAADSVALTGQSGAAKSTLLHLIGAIEQADAETIRVGGFDVSAARRGPLAGYRTSIGFVFQRFHLLPALTARDKVLAPLSGRRGDRVPPQVHKAVAAGPEDRVPKGCIVVLGDNAPWSADSRTRGYLRRRSVIGVVPRAHAFPQRGL